jgi:hypothetical protein
MNIPETKLISARLRTSIMRLEALRASPTTTIEEFTTAICDELPMLDALLSSMIEIVAYIAAKELGQVA